MKHILVPTDFSENAWNALQYGLELLSNNKCTFYLMHVNPIPGYSGAGTSLVRTSSDFAESLLRSSMEELQTLIDQIKTMQLNANHNFVPLAFYSNFIDTVKNEVRAKKINLILMGTKGATGLKKATVGSNTGDVITKVKCPLLAVPEDAVYKKPRQIAFPTDFQMGYDLKVLDGVLEMTTANNAILHILHMSKQGEELNQEQLKNKDFLQDYFVDIDHSFHTLIGSKLENIVQCFTETRKIDMIAMVAKNLNFFQRILFRPAVEEISYHTKVPFLVLHE